MILFINIMDLHGKRR